MTELNQQQIDKLTKLSRIRCTKEEKARLLEDLQKILSYVEQLEEIDTSGVAPCDHVLKEIINVMRKDEVGKPMPREIFLANAPDKIGGLIRVPPVMKNKEA